MSDLNLGGGREGGGAVARTDRGSPRGKFRIFLDNHLSHDPSDNLVTRELKYKSGSDQRCSSREGLGRCAYTQPLIDWSLTSNRS